MKSAPAPVISAIRSAYDVKALPKLTAEWNMNRYYTTTVANTPAEIDEGFDTESFPIESIVEPIRPTKGMAKGLVQHATVADDYHTPSKPRFHVVSVDDQYKYWIAPFQSAANGAISGVNPQVIYGTAAAPVNVSVNKISITVENTFASPNAYQIQVTTNGGSTWTTVGSPPVGNDGRLVLWWNGTSWQNAQPTDLSTTTSINGVRFVVTSLTSGMLLDGSITQYKQPMTNTFYNTDGASAWFSLIEISARRVVDLSSRIIDCSSTFDAGEANHLTPVGTITSNTGSVELWNGDNYFSTENTSSPYYNLIEPNVAFNLSYIYYIGTSTYEIQDFKMYVDEWAESGEHTTSVSLSDASKYLKETKPRPTKYENYTLAQIVYRLCDSVGFGDYNISPAVNAVDYVIPVWYTDGEQTLWEIFDELAQAYQSLIYFDAYGKLNVKTREDAYNRSATPVWNLRAAKSGSDLPDIISLEQTDTYEANSVKVIYNAAKWADVTNGFTEFTTVWEPDGTTTLRSSALIRQLNPSDTELWLTSSEAKIWPFSGMCQIEGETIRYKGKYFYYYEGDERKSKWVEDQDEYDKLNALVDSGNRYLNYFDGRLKITERGVWNTEVETHKVEASGYDIKRFGPSSVNTGNAGFRHNKQRSTVTLEHGGRLASPAHFMTVLRGNQSDTGWRHMGCRIKFNEGNNVDQRAGLVFNVNGNKGGYYVELTPKSHLTARERQSRKEVSFYTITGSQPNTRIPPQGREAMIVEDRWHTIDIYYGWDNQSVNVWIDGKKAISATVPAGQQFTPNGKFGMFIRGRTEVEFEYLYGIARADEPVPLDDFSSVWNLDGWHDGLKLYREWKFEWKKRKKSNKPKYRKNFQYMDEFGPYVHEIREFDVKFDPSPVQYSKIFSTNFWSAMLIDYRADAFGARFTMCNAERHHAVVHGEDTLTFPGVDGSSINQQLLVYGRALVVGEDVEVVSMNEAQFKARGEISTELNSPLIQTKAAAEALGKWITEHWGRTVDQLQVEVFGNPLFEVGDLVAIDDASRSMTTTTNQYFVTGINTKFDSGIVTSLTLQRKN
jgi:hypothetical protein